MRLYGHQVRRNKRGRVVYQGCGIQPDGGTLCVPEKGETKNPNGRPRMIFSQLAKAWKDKGVERATPARVIEMYEYLLGLTIEEINEIAQNGEDGKDNGYPAFIRLAAVEMMGENRIKILQEMLDRAHGKAMPAANVRPCTVLNFVKQGKNRKKSPKPKWQRSLWRANQTPEIRLTQ